MRTRERGDVEARDRRRVRERLAEVAHDARDDIQRVRLDDELVMVGGETLGDQARPLELVISVLAEADRERAHRLGRCLGHRRHHPGRVDATGQERAQRHVAQQSAPDGGAEPVAELLGDLAVVARDTLARVVQAPVPLDRRAAALVNQHGRGRQFANGTERAARRRDGAQPEVRVEGLVIEVARDLGIAQQGAQLGGKGDRAAQVGVEQGLLADTIARQDEPTAGGIPDRHGEHAMQTPDAPRALVLVEVHDDLGVAAGGERMARADEPPAQLRVVVDLPVEHDRDRAVLVEDRLVSGLKVDHPQPLDPETGAFAQVGAARVRTTVLEFCAHVLDQRRVDRAPVCHDLAHDPAHQAATSAPAAESSAPSRCVSASTAGATTQRTCCARLTHIRRR